jgi:intracellular septation protein
MQILVDFLPIIAFVAVYQIYGALVSADDAMFAATIAIMLVMTVQILIQWIRTRTVNRILLVSGVLVLIFGGITLALRDIAFIQWKPTILNWLLAAACLVSQFVGKQTLIERMLSEAIALPQRVWRRLNLMWVGNFALLGAINLYVVYNFSEAAWVKFKLYGLIGLPLLMGLIQGIYISRYLPDDAGDKSSPP